MLKAMTYICPACRGGLAKEDDGYFCPSCTKRYPIVENIPVFGNPETYYGEINQAEMAELIENSRKYGYKEAISKIVKDPFVLTYILDENRALWADLLPLDADTEFLDVGCGWGTIAIPMAKRVGHVAAIDNTLERVKFVELRADESGLNNITPALASATSLPYPDDTFDIVAFNGVLEWLGAINENEIPKKIQLQALKEALRVLRPGGTVYIGIENRFSLRYFLGTRDDHSFIRFTSIMPRWMSHIYYKIRTGKNYFMHTHSLPVYRQMLRRAGFSRILEYYPWPNYRNPSEFIELDKSRIMDFLGREIRQSAPLGRKWVYLALLRLLTAIDGQGFFCHSFLFIYRKPR
jgi:ubiquinone/menaquinone biosynthesis C-methylase UbiE